jgi:hypothetical protein
MVAPLESTKLMIFPDVPPVVRLEENALGGGAAGVAYLKVDAERGGIGVGSGAGAWIDVRYFQRAVAEFVARHFACAECGVGGNHVQAGVIRSAVGGQIEDSDVVARGDGRGFGAYRNARRHAYRNGIRHSILLLDSVHQVAALSDEGGGEPRPRPHLRRQSEDSIQ